MFGELIGGKSYSGGQEEEWAANLKFEEWRIINGGPADCFDG